MTSVPIQGEAEAPSKFWVLLTASLASSLIMLDSNIVAVSLPAIGRSLGASFSDVQWVISAYVLTYASLLLASGGYADLRGRRIHAHRLGHFCRCIRRLRLGDELTATEFGSRYARCGQGFPCHRIHCHPDERVHRRRTQSGLRVLGREPRDRPRRWPHHRRRNHEFRGVALGVPGECPGIGHPGPRDFKIHRQIPRSERQAARHCRHRHL